MKYYLKNLNKNIVPGEEDMVARVKDMPIDKDDFMFLNQAAIAIGVTDQFKDVMATFPMPDGETPAGFERVYSLDEENVLRVDLKRNISYDKNGVLRPTNVLFSADSADPYEVAHISSLIANLTCNPGIIYDLFLNNPKANVDNAFKTREEVMTEIARILGPGCDISVELNNPFEEDFGKLLEEAATFREIFSKYRIVIKVPHCGPVTGENVSQLISGDKKLDTRYDDVTTGGAFRGHNLALKMKENGYRVNFTLMFEPFQTQLALQAKPYFVNSFVRHRYVQSSEMKRLLDAYEVDGDKKYLEELREFMFNNDYLTRDDLTMDLDKVRSFAADILKYRQFDNAQGSDGLDSMRHNLRVLKNCNLPDTRLIVCSMDGPHMYPDIDKVLTEPEFQCMNNRVVITAEPNYLAQFTSTNQVISYQRRFMNAVESSK